MPTKSTKNPPGSAELSGKSGGTAPGLKLALQRAARASGVPLRADFRKWIKAALARDAEIVLRIVNESEGRQLNRDFRHKDYATNVLTFVYDDSRILCGDIVLCAPVIEKEAMQQHKDLAAHYAHLTVHGVLHLQGHEHDNDASAAVMERLEAEILGKLGYVNPYEVHPAAGDTASGKNEVHHA